MGLDRTIRFTSAPTWDAVRTELHRIGFDASLRMIDGMPAFPDESPEESWKELRLGFAAGMVTLRRGTDHFSCVVWGNADASLTQAWNALCWACASVSGGSVETAEGPMNAEAFGRAAGLFPS